MKRLLLILLIMIPVIDGCGTAGKTNATATTETTAEGPKGDLVYCSFSETRNGGLGKDYCELVADPGTVPEVRKLYKLLEPCYARCFSLYQSF